MGDHITRPATSAELSRAKFLREALQRRTQALSSPAANATATPEAITGSFATDGPELQRAYLEQLVGCAPEAITILDPEYRITRINGEFTRIFGFAPEEALGQRIDRRLRGDEVAGLGVGRDQRREYLEHVLMVAGDLREDCVVAE